MPLYTIVGGVCNGYRLHEDEKPLPFHFTQMWDAIKVRDKLNRGELKIGEAYRALLFAALKEGA